MATLFGLCIPIIDLKFGNAFLGAMHMPAAVATLLLLLLVLNPLLGVLSRRAMLARSRFAWFPPHPIGILMRVPFAMHSVWLSIFLGWACKVTITKFARNDGYRKTVPLFLGLALGSIVSIIFWVMIDGWQSKVGHALLPF